MATVLFTWELGAGIGHMAPYKLLTDHLAAQGHKVLFAIRDLSRARQVFRDANIHFLQAPIKTGPIRNPIGFPANYGQILQNLGYEDRDELLAMVEAWRALFEFAAPDLVVLDHSPTALMALRGMPSRTMLIGLGFFIPPDMYPTPNLRSWSNIDLDRMRADEDRILGNINWVLEQNRQPTLSRLSQMFAQADERILTTFPELDHYGPWREDGEYVGLLGSYSAGVKPAWPQAPGKRIFSYLKQCANLPQVLEAVRDLQQPTIVVPDRLGAEFEKKLEAPHIHLQRELLDLPLTGEQCDLAIHNANHTTMVELLLRGKPCVMVPTHLEQWVLALRTQEQGVGVLMDPAKPETFAAKLKSVLEDTSYTAAAQRFAHKYAGFKSNEQGQKLLTRMEKLLGASPTMLPAAAPAPAAGAPQGRARPRGTSMPSAPMAPPSGPMPNLEEAINLHRQGKIAQAERMYATILQHNPQHVDALHLMGVAAHQRGDSQHAVELIGKAISINPNVPAFHANLAEPLRRLGNLGRAEGSCRTALKLQPQYPDAANNLGLALQAQGRHEDAAEAYRMAVRQNPQFAMAHNNLANCLREMGHEDDAILHFKTAVQIMPHMVEGHSNLTQLLLEKRRLDEAETHGRKAVELNPKFPPALNNLGNVLRELGNLDEAKKIYQRALEIAPRQAMTFNNMGQALQEEGMLDQAIGWYQKALEIEPNTARFYSNLASALADYDREADAVKVYEMALQKDPNYAEAMNGLGATLRDLNRPEEAEALLKRAIEARPTFPGSYSNLGHLCEELGRMEEAEQLFRKTLELDPDHAGAYCQLATMLKKRMSDEDIGRMQVLLTRREFQIEGRVNGLHYGLAQVLDAKGEHGQAGEHLKIANADRLAYWSKRNKGYSPAEHEAFVDQLIATVTPEFFVKTQGYGLTTEKPVFIVGLPRSATTLTEQILASHSRVHGAGERRFAKDAFDRVPALMNQPEAQTLDLFHQMMPATVQQAAQGHLDELDRLDANALRVVDKMPDNYLHLGWIATMFPHARLIHCRRDLRDIAVSCWMTNFRSIRWACDFDHIATRFEQYRRVMDHWRKVLPVPLLEVDYEETVNEPEQTARRLVDWIGMEWEDACLEFHKLDRPVRTASVTQVREPIYKRSVERWRNYEQSMGPLFERLQAGA